MFEDAGVSVVHRLMVHPAFQGRGIARELMEFAERVALNRGCGVIRLDAFAMNPQALRLYRALGYREAGEVKFRKGAFLCFEKRLGLAN
jgi:ribosomal protein S18 acetylase RimI-like enzyme